MDGLPGLQRAVKTGQTDRVKPMKKMVGRFAAVSGQPRKARRVFKTGHLVLGAALISSLGTAVLLLVSLRLFGAGIGRECKEMHWEAVLRR